MIISSIRESGPSNLLRWAIENKADLKNNTALSSLINDELFYLITIDDVNYYEVFRLTQLYRNKLRIILANVNKIPDNADLKERFPSADINSIRENIERFLSLTAQMAADDDIIEEGVPRLYIPMMASTFTIQIPFSFMDVIDVISENDTRKLFSPDYPKTLDSIVEEGKFVLLKSAVFISIEKNTRNIRYDPKYEKLLEITKYFPLKRNDDNNNELFKHGLIGFSKYDNIARSEVRCNLYRADKSDIESKIKQLSRLNTPLELEFAIQLPIYHMNILEALYYPEDLKISYRSSIANILDNGMIYHDFKFTDDESRQTAIEAYKVRITEADHDMIETINSLIQLGDCHNQSIFSLLPPIYLTNAVITINYDMMSQYVKTSNTSNVLYSLFKKIEADSNSIYRAIHDK